MFREHFFPTCLGSTKCPRRAGSFDTKHNLLAQETADLRFFVLHYKRRFVSHFDADISKPALADLLQPAVFGSRIRRPVLQKNGLPQTTLAFLVVRLAGLRALSGA